jgi:hypothetical protein
MPDFTRRRASSAEAQVGEDANNSGSSPSFSSLSPYLLLLSGRATELRLATILLGIVGDYYKWRLTPLFIAFQGRFLQGLLVES